VQAGRSVVLPLTLVASAWCCWLLFGSAAEQRADGAYGGQRKADEKEMLQRKDDCRRTVLLKDAKYSVRPCFLPAYSVSLKFGLGEVGRFSSTKR